MNETPVPAGWTMGFDRDGRELVVVAIKATYTMPSDDSEPRLADDQVPLVEADEFTGDPGVSAPRYECDYAHRKPMCDVLLNGSAYAPPGKVVRQTMVGMRVGPMVKTFAVVGDRTWRKGVMGVTASDPEPFDVMPITYDTAFGGEQYLPNPVGRGRAGADNAIDGQPLPNTQEADTPVKDPHGSYRPMSFGPLGRHWHPRAKHAGTYDKRWMEERAPFWPDDFSYAYFQAAPPDQQIPYPSGGEEVILKHLTPEGHVQFRLPATSTPVWCIPYRGKATRVASVPDTVLIEPDSQRFTITARAVVPMRRSCFDLRQVIVGEQSPAWQRAQQYGNKPYFKSLADLARSRRRQR